ncbi:MAG TPA: sigma-54 dependent transcriptional regulator [Phycisphaerae bacterium]|nr:sigma-54-dependent Fis family transcriptional regulator [Phycisphaerales bacterium]HRX86649.1 sigma-54 dependent transcriptional regulator [Phycisphaerae bacterium]
MARILIIEDEAMLARNMRESLALTGHDVSCAGSGEAGLDEAERHAPDVVLLDLRLPGIDGLDVVRELQRRGSSASVVVMTAYGNVDSAVEAIRCGVSDYLTKPLDLRELDLVIDRVLQHRRLAANLEYFRSREQQSASLDSLIGESPPMQAVKQFIRRIVATPALSSEMAPPMLLTGETGTGKDLVARAVHYAGPRRDAPFVHLNCTALPEHLVEAELFGHVKGAFTDARGDKRGLFEVADGGTIFLDEIGHMPAALQAKLLGVIEHRRIRPVGGTVERKIDIHIIAATNRNLVEAIESGAFRDDLYHRLRVLTIHLPALSARGGDIDLLAEHFVRLYAGRFGLSVAGLAPAALARLHAHDWPGNVRELSHTLESAVLITDGPQIQPEHLNLEPPAGETRMSIELTGDQVIELDFAGGNARLEDVEYRIIRAALDYAKHNVSRAARLLGISRDAVRYRLEKYEKEHGPQD